MLKTILVPTDLQVGSLNTLKACLSMNNGERLHIILMHAMHGPDGIGDLLFYSRRKVFGHLVTPAFKEALAVLLNRFEQCIVRIEVLPFHGRTQAAFDQFVTAMHVDELHSTDMYSLKPHKRSFDPMPFIRKSRLAKVEHGLSVSLQNVPVELAQDHLQLLFEQ